jgi:hypothetical protein
VRGENVLDPASVVPMLLLTCYVLLLQVATRSEFFALAFGIYQHLVWTAKIKVSEPDIAVFEAAAWSVWREVRGAQKEDPERL